MGFVRVRFEIHGDVQVSRAFEAAADQVEDLSEPLREIGVQIFQSVGQQFATEGAHGLGTKWRPLDREYEAWKREAVGPNPLLVLSGEMRRAMLEHTSMSVSPRRLVYAPDVGPSRRPSVSAGAVRWVPVDPDGERALAHQEGRGDNPQRKMVALTNSEKRQWERTFHEWLRRDVGWPGTYHGLPQF